MIRFLLSQGILLRMSFFWKVAQVILAISKVLYVSPIFSLSFSATKFFFFVFDHMLNFVAWFFCSFRCRYVAWVF